MSVVLSIVVLQAVLLAGEVADVLVGEISQIV